jgi:hypothetical protein
VKRKPNFKFWFLILLLIVTLYDHRKILHSGFNDLVIGSQSFRLYTDNTFYLEMGAGGVEGNYLLVGDTVKLSYYEKPSTNWPDIMLIRENYFISLDNSTKQTLKIKRDK